MKRDVLLLTVALISLAISADAAERHIRHPRVPADKLAEARALTNPLPDSPEIVEKGRVLYLGKGTCVNCHGKDGDGHGPVAAQLDPSPRNFHRRGFWEERTEGEMFWVIKHGSAGTSMVGFGDALSDEEIWAIVRYLHGFAGQHQLGMMGPRKGRGPMRGRHGGMGQEGMGSGDGSCEGEHCHR